MLNITFNALRFRPSIAPVWGQLRWRSTQPQPAAAEHIIERDPEWDNARSYDDIPSPTLFGFLKEFGPFGKYKDATLYDINCRMRELYGPIMRMKGSFGREDIVLSFNPEDFEKVFRTEGVVRMEKNPSVSSDSLSILEKLLKVDRNAAFIMSLDSLFAGVDTTSSGSTGILYCLAHNPEKQDKLREELRKILPDKNSKLTAENMKNMPYLRACIKEGLRMYPPTTGNGRCVGKDLVLQGYRIPKGTMVAMGQLVLQRQEGQFTRPSEFLPERWLSGPETAGCPSAKEAHPFVYMPFGFGARTCIGRRLAMMEMEILVSRLIHQYHVRWNYGEIKFRASVVNVPSTDLKFELKDVRE